MGSFLTLRHHVMPVTPLPNQVTLNSSVESVPSPNVWSLKPSIPTWQSLYGSLRGPIYCKASPNSSSNKSLCYLAPSFYITFTTCYPWSGNYIAKLLATYSSHSPLFPPAPCIEPCKSKLWISTCWIYPHYSNPVYTSRWSVIHAYPNPLTSSFLISSAYLNPTYPPRRTSVSKLLHEVLKCKVLPY